jgi:hypothetical protein
MQPRSRLLGTSFMLSLDLILTRGTVSIWSLVTLVAEQFLLTLVRKCIIQLENATSLGTSSSGKCLSIVFILDHFELIIVMRGGGAETLPPLNEEIDSESSEEDNDQS